MFLLVPAYPGCPGSKAVKRSLLLLSLLYVLTNQSGPSGQICLTFVNAEVSVNLALAKKILLKLCVRVEVSSVESNETTVATVSCDLALPPQRRRRRHPPPPPPRNLPSVSFQGSKETYLSLHNRVLRAVDIDRQLRTPCCRHRSSATGAPQHGAQQQTRTTSR